MPHIQSQHEWEEAMCEKILNFIHNELYLELRFLNLALSALKAKSGRALQTFATDGTYLFYPAERMLPIFQKNQTFLNRAYLHSVLHCIFSHLWTMGNRNRKLWDIACDITVEYTIDHLNKTCTKRIITWQRQQLYTKLETEKKIISAAVVYRILPAFTPEQLDSLQKEFYTDDHCYWPFNKQTDSLQKSAKNKWDKIARQTSIQQKQRGSNSTEGSRLLTTQLKADKGRRSYSDFLKKFTVLHEELHCDPDEFDLNFYIYGLDLYKNMPLIEPIETREIRKIREFVIVIDTSDSTSGELIKNFLRETFQILSHREYFFSHCRLRILQCDDKVRMDQEIASTSQLDYLLENFTIIGGGRTDFRPAFSYVNELITQKKLKHLDGLLYFTDGLGIYPKKCPPYKTAFLFLEDFDESAVPPWAMRLRLEPEEFINRKENKRYEYQTSKAGNY